MAAGAGVAAAAVAAPPARDSFDGRSAGFVQTDAVLTRLCRVVKDVLGAGRATVLLLSDAATLVPAVSGADDVADIRPLSFELSPEAAAALRRETAFTAPDAAFQGEWVTAYDLTSFAVAPLHVDGRPWGALIVDDNGRDLGPADLSTLTELAGLATVAISAAQCAAVASAEAGLRSAVRESVGRLHATLDLGEAVDGVAPFLLDASGFEPTGATILDPALAGRLAVPTTGGLEADALRRLRHGAGEVVTSDGRLLVPLRNHHGLFGVLELRSSGSAAKRLDLVHEVADRFAATIDQVASAERDAEHDAETEHAQVRVALARQAIGRTLRTFRGAGYAKGGPTLFDVSSVNNARRALEELDEVRQVLGAQSSSPALATALKALLDGVPAKAYDLAWATHGAPRPIAPESEIACLRTALRFASLVRETRGSVLAVRLSYAPDAVEIVLSSNGLLSDGGADTPVGELVGPWIRDVGGTAVFEADEASFSVRLTLPAPAAGR